MKYLFYLYIILKFNTICVGQNNEVEFQTNYGVSTEYFKITKAIPSNKYSFEDLHNVNNKDISLSYKYKIVKKFNFYLSTGIMFSNVKYYLKIIDLKPYYYANVFIKKNYLTFKIFGINKQFNLYNDNLIIDIGVNTVKRFFFKTNNEFSSNYLNTKDPNVRYKYNIKTYFYNKPSSGSYFTYNYQNRFLQTLEYSLQLKYRIFNNTFFNLGFKYSKKLFFRYNYSYVIEYHTGVNPTIITHFSDLGLIDGNLFRKIDNFGYFNIGLTKKF